MYKNTKRNILFPSLLAVAVAAGILIGSLLGRNSAESQQRRSRTLPFSGDKIGYTLSLIENLYVDSVNMDSIAEHVLPVLVKELDPHSVYIPVPDMAAANETLDGEFDGIGVVFNMATDTVIVLNVISSGPSDKAGVKAGDRIIRIDDSLVAGRKIPQDRIVKLLRGKRGTKVNLSLQRSGIGDLVPVTVERGVIPIKSIDAAFMIAPQVGFVKLTAFSKNSYGELKAALDRLKGEGMTRLIFDLRGNTGGFLDQAIRIANEFLPGQKLIVYTEDKRKRRVEEFSDGRGGYTDMPLAILIDEGSASSSEILAGAIQDNDRGTVIGRRSYGKGLVQQQFPYPDGSALRLTIARYYTPTGRSIQKPYTHGTDEYNNDLVTRFRHNEMFSADSIKFADSLRFTTPGGKVVYGGGGIMPDIFVPLDTTDMTPYFLEVTGRNILYKYTIEYSDRIREKLNEVRTVSELDALLDSDPGLFDDFIAYASRRGVAPDKEQIERSRALITAQLRAYIGRNSVLEDAGFYSNIYPIDNVIVRAIDELNGQ